MRALRVERLDGPAALVLRDDIEAPAPGPGEIAYAVHAAGVNFPDVLMSQGRYQHKPRLPFTLGIEAAGVVTAAGEGVTEWRPGDRVVASPATGGYAEIAVADAATAVRVPHATSFATAAAMLLTYGTAWHALVTRGALRARERLAVTGAGGGVGTAACEIGRVLGARVVALVGSEEKRAAALGAGAHVALIAADGDTRDAIRAECGGLDVLLDTTGGAPFDAGLRALDVGGRALIVGFASGTIPAIPANRLLLRELDARGVAWGAWQRREPQQLRAHFAEMFALVAAERLHPHPRTMYPFEHAADAVAAMWERRLVGKAVVTVQVDHPPAVRPER
ncbi:MAG: NADPH:quinone oxidoreductase family protein [Candidatus Eremiobacteraeota bacterium]|nr:NADPH:quinone oxidoreductase family protein [Candidatus Eremiobacteraeota bacterium]